MFITMEEIHSYGTRSSKKGNFNVKLMSISIMGVKLWNKLDTMLKQLIYLST